MRLAPPTVIARVAVTAVLGVSAAATHGWAAGDRPVFPPSRDAAVTYHVRSDREPGGRDVRVEYSAVGRKLRVDSAGQGFLVIDVPAGPARLVIPNQQMMVELPSGAGAAQVDAIVRQGRFTRIGSETVAGLRCTDWRVESARGNGTACVTDDGVILRARGSDAQNHTADVEAVSISLAAQPAADFEVPDGYRKVDLSHLNFARVPTAPPTTRGPGSRGPGE